MQRVFATLTMSAALALALVFPARAGVVVTDGRPADSSYIDPNQGSPSTDSGDNGDDGSGDPGPDPSTLTPAEQLLYVWVASIEAGGAISDDSDDTDGQQTHGPGSPNTDCADLPDPDHVTTGWSYILGDVGEQPQAAGCNAASGGLLAALAVLPLVLRRRRS